MWYRARLLGLDNLATLVVAAVATHAVGQLDLAALRANRARGHGANVIGDGEALLHRTEGTQNGKAKRSYRFRSCVRGYEHDRFFA